MGVVPADWERQFADGVDVGGYSEQHDGVGVTHLNNGPVVTAPSLMHCGTCLGTLQPK